MHVDAPEADLSGQVDRCVVMSRAQQLAVWVGDGRPVTAKGVLRPVDVRAAADALGVEIVGHVRSGADVEAIHRPWVAAQALGMLRVDDRRAFATVDGGVSVSGWLTALDAVLREESHDDRRQGAAVLCRTLLTVLATDPPTAAADVEETVYELLEHISHREAHAVFEAFRRGIMPVDAGLELLAEFGTVDDNGRLTTLGRWAYEQFRDRTPAQIEPDLPARDVLARLAVLPEDEAWRQGLRWLADRDLGTAAQELLRAAATATPAERIAAVDLVTGFDDPLVSVWQAAVDEPNLAAHARAVLYLLEQTPEPDATTLQWLAVEHALAALATDGGAEQAYHYLEDQGGTQILDGTSHPGAGTLREALAAFIASGAAVTPVYQLKISLTRMRTPVWRRVLVPASTTLARLHEIIRVLFDWDEEHLHVFTADGHRFSDPAFGLEECGDAERARLTATLPRAGTTMTYVYDLGDWWEHQITLEKVLDPDDATKLPLCTGGRGDAPVEDWNPEYPEDPTPYDREAINKQLAASAHQSAWRQPSTSPGDEPELSV
jgi:hypothetical protein